MNAKTKAGLYSGVGRVMTHYDLDLESCSLIERGSITLSENIQYAWPHSEKPILYVSVSDRINRDNHGTEHSLCALRIDESGELSIYGPVVALPYRAVHITVDARNRFLIAAVNQPATLVVIRINDDGTLGEIRDQSADVNPGVFPHQVRISPDDRYCISIARGNPPVKGWWSAKGKQRDPGSLNVFAYDDGRLGHLTSVTIDDGYMFGPRHLDFHPQGPWVYVSLETQNEAVVFQREVDGMIAPEPLQRLPLLENAEDILVHQGAGTVHVHPKGHAVYFVNRGHQDVPYPDGKKILLGDLVDNSFVVCGIDRQTGLLTELQRIDSGGICARTFSLDPSGRMLVAGNSETHWVKHSQALSRVSANLSTFKVLDDGRLEFRNRYELDLPFQYLEPSRQVSWVGIVAF